MKIFWVSLLVFLVTLSILGVGGYFLIKSRSPFCINNIRDIFPLASQDDEPKTAPNQSNEFDKLKTYTDDAETFSFQYPEGINMEGELKEKEVLNVRFEKISDIENQPLGWDRQTADSDILALKDGDPSVGINFGNINTYKTLNILGAVGKEFITFGTFDVCDVQFSRYAVIYKDDYRVVISLKINDINGAKSEAGEYFGVDSENCADKTVWNDQDGFYKALKGGAITSHTIGKWFKDFDTIVKTFKFKS